eukprot:1727063-Rhodomonas_salina.1
MPAVLSLTRAQQEAEDGGEGAPSSALDLYPTTIIRLLAPAGGEGSSAWHTMSAQPQCEGREGRERAAHTQLRAQHDSSSAVRTVPRADPV